MRGMMAGVLLAVSVAASVVSVPARAQQGGTAEFSIGTVNYTVPIPAGYCLPEGARQIELARYGASLDKENVTPLTLYSCGPSASMSDYVLVKTPTALTSTRITLANILQDPQFARAEKPSAQTGVEDTLEGALAEQTGKDIAVSTAVAALGHDDVCGLIGGSVTATGDRVIHVSLGGCMTSLGDRAFVVFFYADGNDPATVKRLMAKARVFAMSVRVRP